MLLMWAQSFLFFTVDASQRRNSFCDMFSIISRSFNSILSAGYGILKIQILMGRIYE